MDCSFELDLASMILRVTITGTLTDAELNECYETTRQYASRTNPRSAVLDLTHVTKVELATETLERIAESPPILQDPALRIIVADSDYLYGLARMFQTLGEKTRQALHVVRTLDNAYALVGVKSPQFEPLSADLDYSA